MLISTLFTMSYPINYTSCGLSYTLPNAPSRVITMNQGATELMLAMGLGDKIIGTAYLDDSIWPQFEESYNKIPVLSATYPTENQIFTSNPDFIVASYRSAFREKVGTSGIFSNETFGPCEGAGSDWFESGSNATTLYSTCRPQLHAAGIGTWLEPVSCEDSALRPAGGASEETVYAAIRQFGAMFNEPGVAEQLISTMKLDFDVAADTVKQSGHELKAVWLDCLDCCGGDPNLLFVGSGEGAPNLIMSESGLTNAFAERNGSWTCVNITEVIAADPDIVVLVNASWDTALSKLDFMYKHQLFCEARFMKRADFIVIPFSASTLGPRNGAAALDMASAAMHVSSGTASFNFKSGVTFFDPDLLVQRTSNSLCPLKLEDIAYARRPPAPPSPPSTSTSDSNDLPGWGVAIIVVFCSLSLACFAIVFVMFKREKSGKPIFTPVADISAKQPPSNVA